MHNKLSNPFNSLVNENFVHQVRQNLYNNDQIQKLIPQLIGKKNPSDAYNEAQFKSVKATQQPQKQAVKLNRVGGQSNNHQLLSQQMMKEPQDSLNSSEQENTPEKVPHHTLYSDDEGGAPHHQRELSQKDFNDTKSEQLLQSRLTASKKLLNRNSLTTPQNMYDMSVLKTQLLTEQNMMDQPMMIGGSSTNQMQEKADALHLLQSEQ